jgi:hypothetical protein
MSLQQCLRLASRLLILCVAILAFVPAASAEAKEKVPIPFYTSTSCALGSYSTIYPATALAATVNGEAKYICPGPLRPGKLRFCALITT